MSANAGNGFKEFWSNIVARTVPLCFAAYCGALLLRLVEAHLWGADFRVAGQPLLATNDAYYWLAGAKGLGPAAGSPLARMAAYIASLTGTALAAVGFWTPPFVAALVAPVVTLWGRMLGNTLAGFWAGVLAACAPAFMSRTRLGFYDTDMVTLLFPLAAGGILAWWLGRTIREGKSELWMPLAAAVVAAAGAPWHRLLPLAFAAEALMSGLCVALFAPAEKRAGLFAGVGLFLICALSGAPGLIGGGALGLLVWRKPELLQRMVRLRWLPWIVLGGCLAFFLLSGTGSRLFDEAAAYLQRAVSKNISRIAPEAPRFPPMTGSIEEAMPVDAGEFLGGLHPWAGVGLLGLLGAGFLARKRPLEILVLLPLLCMGLLSFRWGERTIMFCAPLVALGLTFGAERLIRLSFPGKKGQIVYVAAMVLVLAPLARGAMLMRPEAVLTSEYAAALERLREITPPDARLWTWWDYGHAARFYAEREPFAEGGRQGPEYVYLLGRVYGSASPRAAAALMAYTARLDYAPWNVWQYWTAERTAEFVDSLDAVLEPPQPQYLVVSADSARHLQTILRFASWRLDGGFEAYPEFFAIPEYESLDMERGVLHCADGDQLPLSEVLVYRERNGLGEFVQGRYNHAGSCLLEAQPVDIALLAAPPACETLLVSLLFRPVEALSLDGALELVLDAAPHVRVFKVLHDGAQ